MICKERQDSAKFSNWRPKATEPGKFVSYRVGDWIDCFKYSIRQCVAALIRSTLRTQTDDFDTPIDSAE